MIIDMNFRGMRWQMPEVAQAGEYATVAHNMYRINSALVPLRAGDKATLIPTNQNYNNAKTLFLHDDKFLAFDYETDVETTQVVGDKARRLYLIDKNGLLTVMPSDSIPNGIPTSIDSREIVGIGGPNANIAGYALYGMVADIISGTNPLLDVFNGQDSDSQETAFLYTFINKYGEESAPSPASRSLLYVSGDTTINLTAALSDNTIPNPNVVAIRVYMLVDGLWRRITSIETSVPETSSTAEIPNVTINVRDNPVSDTITFTVDPALTSEELISAEWLPPPNSLVAMASLDNGVLAVATEHDIYLSEPYYWHTYPQSNSYSVDGTIKHIANIGGGFAVMTDKGTKFFFGSSPDSMVQSSVNFPYSIVDRSSFTAFEGGGAYVCDDGIAVITAGGGQIATDGWIDRENWRDRVDLAECRIGMYEGRVLLMTRNPENNNPIGYCFNMELGEVTSFDIDSDALDAGFFRDPRNNEVCYVESSSGMSVFNRGSKRVALWESGDIWLPRTISLNTAYVESDGYPVEVEVTPKDRSSRSITVNKPRARRMPSTGRAKSVRVRIESGHQVGRSAVATDMRGF